MTAFGVQGQLLEINVLGCKNLRDKEWLSRQDPYVVIQYAGTKLRTKTDTDGGRNPSFNQKLTLPLIEGLREIHVEVWNSNTVTLDDFIGSGRVLLEKALTTGYDDSTWNLNSKSGKYAGELRVILHYNRTEKQPKPMTSAAYPTASPHHAPYPTAPPPQAYPYGAPPPSAAPYGSPYPAAPAYYGRQTEYPPPSCPYHPTTPGAYPSASPSYSASPYAPPSPAPPPAGYPPVYQEYPYRPY